MICWGIEGWGVERGAGGKEISGAKREEWSVREEG